jgi:hypothetical protein
VFGFFIMYIVVYFFVYECGSCKYCFLFFLNFCNLCFGPWYFASLFGICCVFNANWIQFCIFWFVSFGLHRSRVGAIIKISANIRFSMCMCVLFWHMVVRGGVWFFYYCVEGACC